jgi:hypothetical protein
MLQAVVVTASRPLLSRQPAMIRWRHSGSDVNVKQAATARPSAGPTAIAIPDMAMAGWLAGADCGAWGWVWTTKMCVSARRAGLSDEQLPSRSTRCPNLAALTWCSPPLPGLRLLLAWVLGVVVARRLRTTAVIAYCSLVGREAAAARLVRRSEPERASIDRPTWMWDGLIDR